VMKKQAGFTFVELLAVIGVLAIVGTIGSGIFFTVLRNSTKVRLETKLKQKGEFAIGVMEKMTRGAWRIEDLDTGEKIGDICDGLTRSSIPIVSPDGSKTIFACYSDTDQIASESANPAILVSGTEVDCSEFITCQLGNNGVPRVVVKFSLSEGSEGGAALPYQKASIQFQTIVAPRNY